jgi:hypothetical protein
MDIAAAVGLKQVTRNAAPLGGLQRPDDVCFQWERP